MHHKRFIVVTPARNEAVYIKTAIESIVSQTVLPCQWVIVDDGSLDNTADIAEDAARIYSWIRVVTQGDRGYRDIGYGDVEAFNKGLSNIETKDYEYLFRIDADIKLTPRYFNIILDKFTENDKLGIAVGEVDELINGNLVRLRSLPYGFNGMVKGWRRTCFEEIGGLPAGPGWDGIDCLKAMMCGWETKTFPDEELISIHLRPEGSSIKSQYHGWARHGRALHFLGAHPLWVIASACYHMADRPFGLVGLCMILGYLDALANRAEQYDAPGFKRYVQDWQMKELARILRLR
jgi:biofilm PGA synthesis N-glycosyltransferase PgaC